jgi:hypothetical protein
MSSTGNVIVDVHIDTQFLSEDVGQRATVPQIHPVALSAALFEVHALMRYDPVESFGPRDGRAEPDLSVRGLLVEHVAVFFGLDLEDTSLAMVSDQVTWNQR